MRAFSSHDLELSNLSELAVPWCYYLGAIINDELVKAMEFAFWIGPLLNFGVLFVKVWSRFWLLSLDDHNDLMTDVHEYAMLRVKIVLGFVLVVQCFFLIVLLFSVNTIN